MFILLQLLAIYLKDDVIMKFLNYLKKEPFLLAGGLLAIATSFIILPDREYLSYCNFKVISLLFCLMAIVEGIRNTGFFEAVTKAIGNHVSTQRGLTFVLCALCFISSALITNDVALITFVPFSLAVLRGEDENTVIYTIVLETVAANLGSLITPVGNPQNMYLYTYFNLTPAEFFKITVPLGALSAGLICAAVFFCKRKVVEIKNEQKLFIDKKSLAVYAALFTLCLLAVFNIISYAVMFVLVTVILFIKNKKLFLKVDYNLLVTFLLFFIFVGNAARMENVKGFIERIVIGREVSVGILLSQFISNVPAAAMLSAFTDDVRALIIGTNIGGLGTLIASMASLISYRKISNEKNISLKKYTVVFSVVNFAFLIILGGIYIFVVK